MPSLTLKNIPDDLMDRLRQAARAERRSLIQQAFHLIDGGLAEWEGSVGIPPAPVAEQVRRWRELAGQWQSSEDFDAEIDAIRASRTEGREVDL